MSQACVAAIDQGTSSTRVLIIGSNGSVLGSHQVEHEQFYPVPGQVEHDPLEIWNSVVTCLSGAIAGLSKKIKIVAIGITNQRETTVVWNKNTGAPYHRAIVWNDTRTRDICEKLSAKEGSDRFRKKTGLPIASYFSATKLMYLLDTVPHLREDATNGTALFGTIDTWIIWKLTNGAVHATDVSNASRTMFMDLQTLQWDNAILKELNIPIAMLPTIRPSSYLFGQVNTDRTHHVAHSSAGGSSEHYGVYHGVPIAGVLGDQNAALFGQACYAPGDSKCTYGTGAFMLFNTGTQIMQSQHGLLTTVAYQLGSPHGQPGGQAAAAVYALEGSVAYSGSVVQWLRDNLQMLGSAKESEAIARSVPENGGVYFVPAFAGLYAPYWRGDARGVIAGLTAYNTKAHIVRAALEASAFQTVEVAQAMVADAQHSMSISSLRVDGGMTANALLMQFLADVLGAPIVRPVITETTALGAAFVAGLAVGLWKDTHELKGLWQAEHVWEPQMRPAERNRLMANWKKALNRSLDWVDQYTERTAADEEDTAAGEEDVGGTQRATVVVQAQTVVVQPRSSGSSDITESPPPPPRQHQHGGAAAGAAAAALGSDVCPVKNPSVVHQAMGLVALAFVVGTAAGAGYVFGVDLVRSLQDSKK